MLKIRNWDRWQSYRKDRGQPPWIKIHRRLMRDPNWVALSDAERGRLVALWMLAADRDGHIPDDPKLLQRLCHMDAPPDINLLIELEFLDAKATPRRRQHVTPKAEAETDTEAEKKEPLRAADAAGELFDIDQKVETEEAEPVDEAPRARLYRKGKTIMVALGVAPKQAGSVIGKWLKDKHDPDGILAALTYAYENNVMEPIGYVTKLLNTGGKTDGRRTNGRQPLVEIGRELAEEARRREFEAGIGRAPDVERGH